MELLGCLVCDGKRQILAVALLGPLPPPDRRECLIDDMQERRAESVRVQIFDLRG